MGTRNGSIATQRNRDRAMGHRKQSQEGGRRGGIKMSEGASKSTEMGPNPEKWGRDQA